MDAGSSLFQVSLLLGPGVGLRGIVEFRGFTKRRGVTRQEGNVNDIRVKQVHPIIILMCQIDGYTW